MQQTTPTTFHPPGNSACESTSAPRTPSAQPVRRGADPRRCRSVFSDATTPATQPAGPAVPLLAPGPLRGDTSAAPPRAASLAALTAAQGSLGEQGVLGLQLRQQGTNAELRLRWGQGAGVVEATLKETGRGVEIQLAAGPDQQRLLHRVAESLASGRSASGFELDGVDVDMDPDLDTHALADLRRDSGHPHQQPDDTQADRPGDDDPARLQVRRTRRSPTGPRLPDGVDTSYCR